MITCKYVLNCLQRQQDAQVAVVEFKYKFEYDDLVHQDLILQCLTDAEIQIIKQQQLRDAKQAIILSHDYHPNEFWPDLDNYKLTLLWLTEFELNTKTDYHFLFFTVKGDNELFLYASSFKYFENYMPWNQFCEYLEDADLGDCLVCHPNGFFLASVQKDGSLMKL